jgi:hypothetical protein
MTPLKQLYWLRVALGVIAALICTGYGTVVPGALSNQGIQLNTFINSLTIALAMYLISFYILKSRFISKLEKPEKLATTGIFMYFITWFVVWVLLFTFIAGPLLYSLTITATTGGTTTPAPGTQSFFAGTQVSVNAKPDTNYALDHWQLDGKNINGTTNPIVFTMNGNHTLNAVFVYKPPP